MNPEINQINPSITLRKARRKDERRISALLSDLAKGPVFFHMDFFTQGGTRCFVAEINKEIVGFGVVAVYRTPIKGVVGRLEDIVVDERLRGRGIGRKLVSALIAAAEDAGAVVFELTSGPQRVPARALYASIGFEPVETGVFRYRPTQKKSGRHR